VNKILFVRSSPFISSALQFQNNKKLIFVINPIKNQTVSDVDNIKRILGTLPRKVPYGIIYGVYDYYKENKDFFKEFHSILPYPPTAFMVINDALLFEIRVTFFEFLDKIPTLCKKT